MGCYPFSTSNIHLNDKDMITKDLNFKDDNLSTYSHHNMNLYDQIMSLKDSAYFKSRKQIKNPYIGLLKGKENSKFSFGKLHIVPKMSDYHKYDNMADGEYRIKDLIQNYLDKNLTYDIALLEEIF